MGILFASRWSCHRFWTQRVEPADCGANWIRVIIRLAGSLRWLRRPPLGKHFDGKVPGTMFTQTVL